MLKKSIIVFSLLLAMNGCAERGQSLNIPQKNVIIKQNTSKTEPYYALKVNANRLENDIIANSVSGSILLFIGLLILL